MLAGYLIFVGFDSSAASPYADWGIADPSTPYRADLFIFYLKRKAAAAPMEISIYASLVWICSYQLYRIVPDPRYEYPFTLGYSCHMRLLLSVDPAYGNPSSDVHSCVDYDSAFYHPVLHAAASGEWLLEVKRSGCLVL